jgi:3',5'-cyclic AMP phosphodiesterase CpdA
MAFLLAHLSDPHLAPLPAPRWSELIGKRVTGYINWQRRRRFIHDPAVLAKIVADLRAQAPGTIAVTGDLSNIALPEEFVRGRAWLASLGAPPDVTVIPGNHDAYVRAAAAEPERCWGEYMRGDDPRLRGDERQSGGFPFVRRRGPLALVGLSTALPTAPFMATGRLGEAQRTRLGETLVALAREKVFRVVLIHHPPVSQAKRHKRLTDAAQFLRVIGAHGAELVLHGHDHLHMLNWLAGPNGTRVPAVGVPSASAAPGKSKHSAGYNLYAIGGAPGAWTCEFTSRGVDPTGAVIERQRVKLFG